MSPLKVNSSHRHPAPSGWTLHHQEKKIQKGTKSFNITLQQKQSINKCTKLCMDLLIHTPTKSTQNQNMKTIACLHHKQFQGTPKTTLYEDLLILTCTTMKLSSTTPQPLKECDDHRTIVTRKLISLEIFLSHFLFIAITSGFHIKL